MPGTASSVVSPLSGRRRYSAPRSQRSGDIRREEAEVDAERVAVATPRPDPVEAHADELHRRVDERERRRGCSGRRGRGRRARTTRTRGCRPPPASDRAPRGYGIGAGSGRDPRRRPRRPPRAIARHGLNAVKTSPNEHAQRPGCRPRRRRRRTSVRCSSSPSACRRSRRRRRARRSRRRSRRRSDPAAAGRDATRRSVGCSRRGFGHSTASPTNDTTSTTVARPAEQPLRDRQVLAADEPVGERRPAGASPASPRPRRGRRAGGGDAWRGSLGSGLATRRAPSGAATLAARASPGRHAQRPDDPRRPGVGERREPADGQAARPPGARRVLGLLPRQLAAHAALRARVARALRGRRPARRSPCTPAATRRRSDPAEVRAAVARLGIEHPVVHRRGASQLWREYGNEAWPARYLFDQRLRLHSMHYGEGAYDETRGRDPRAARRRRREPLAPLRARGRARRAARARRRPSSRAPGRAPTRPAASGRCSSARPARRRRRRCAPTARAIAVAHSGLLSRSSSTSATRPACSSSRSATASSATPCSSRRASTPLAPSTLGRRRRRAAARGAAARRRRARSRRPASTGSRRAAAGP